jgi:hypothetical protein
MSSRDEETCLIGGPRDGQLLEPGETLLGYLPWKFDEFPGVHLAHKSMDVEEVLIRVRRRANAEQQAAIWESRTGIGWGNSISRSPCRDV